MADTTSIQSAISSAVNTTASSSTSASKQLGQEDFLNLLVAQLKNQNPLKPLENEAFIAQLAQFSQLEQSSKLVKLMEQSNSAQEAAMEFNRVALIGRQVKVNGATIPLGTGPASVNYQLAGDAASVKVSILDANGLVVRTLELGAQGAGNQQITWDGKNQSGQAMPSGTYSFAVSATDSHGAQVGASPFSLVTVTGVRMDQGRPLLLAGSQTVDPADIQEIY
ncbi:MAG: FlgD immunoglobulin-like domain containing protein [Nitrospirota bacterium]